MKSRADLVVAFLRQLPLDGQTVRVYACSSQFFRPHTDLINVPHRLSKSSIDRRGRCPDSQSNDHHRNPEKAADKHPHQIAVSTFDLKPVGDQVTWGDEPEDGFVEPAHDGRTIRSAMRSQPKALQGDCDATRHRAGASGTHSGSATKIFVKKHCGWLDQRGRETAVVGLDPASALLGLSAPADMALGERHELQVVMGDQRRETRMRREPHMVPGVGQPDPERHERLHVSARADRE